MTNVLTGHEILEEYAKCLLSPQYVIETYFKTFDKTQESFVPFILFPKQSMVIDAYEKYRNNLVSKPRQAGISTVTAAYYAVKVGFADENNPETIVILANKLKLAMEFLLKIKDFIQQIPRWTWGEEYYGDAKKEKKDIFLTNSKQELVLPNGCKVMAVATSRDALRGLTPTYLIIDEAAYIDEGEEVYGAAMSSLSCIVKNSLILTENGLIELDELVKSRKIGFSDLETPHKVCNKNGKIVDAIQTFVSPENETYKIKTKLGLELEGTWKHPILIKNNTKEEWVKLSELKVGDQPIIAYNQNIFNNSSIFEFNHIPQVNEKTINIPQNLDDNLDFCYLLGLFVAEGNFNKGSIAITNGDQQIMDFLTTDGAKLGNGFSKHREYHYGYSSTKLIKWFEDFGLNKHNAKLKEIPLPLLKMSKPVIKAFLQGMFDGDGMSNETTIKYSTTSPNLAKTLQILLLNFGIISHLKKSVTKTSHSSILTNKDHICTMYDLNIYSDYAIKFYDEIGFRLARKQNNKKFLLDKLQNKRFVNVTKKDILQVLKDNKILKSKLKFLRRFWDSKFNRITYESLLRLKKEAGNHPIIEKLLKQIEIDKNFYIDEIISIEKSTNQTYDLHIPETNSFIGNGFINHNTGGKVTLISTPHSYDALYYKTYANALAGDNDFHITEMHWYEDQRYSKDLKWIKGDDTIIEDKFTFESYKEKLDQGYKPTSTWYEAMCRKMNNDKRMIAQELDVSFIGSGGNVINEEDIAFQEENNVRTPVFFDNEYKEFWIWEQPIEDHKYFLISDVSRGDGEDYSTVEIIDTTTMEQVAEYKGKIMPDVLAYLIKRYAEIYNAYIVVDITGGLGVATVLKLIELKVKNIHYDDPRSKLLKNQESLTKYINQNKKIPGLNVNAIRLPMIANFEQAIRENTIKIRSIRVIHEMKTFVYQGGKPDHLRNHNDDVLQSIAMGLWVLEYSFKNIEKAENQTKAMLNSWVVSGAKEIPEEYKTGFVPKGSKGKAIQQKPRFSPLVAKNMQDPNGDYLWLFSGLK